MNFCGKRFYKHLHHRLTRLNRIVNGTYFQFNWRFSIHYPIELFKKGGKTMTHSFHDDSNDSENEKHNLFHDDSNEGFNLFDDHKESSQGDDFFSGHSNTNKDDLDEDTNETNHQMPSQEISIDLNEMMNLASSLFGGHPVFDNLNKLTNGEQEKDQKGAMTNQPDFMNFILNNDSEQQSNHHVPFDLDSILNGLLMDPSLFSGLAYPETEQDPDQISDFQLLLGEMEKMNGYLSHLTKEISIIKEHIINK